MTIIHYQGDIGSNSERAANDFIRKNKLNGVETNPAINSSKVVASLGQDSCSMGVVAIKNNIGGIVQETKEALTGVNYETIDQVSLPIIHNLCVLKGVVLSDIKQVASHPQALFQCSEFIEADLPDASIIDYKDTALAGRDLFLGKLNSTTAVICSEKAANEYNLSIVAKNIANNANSVTDFILFRLLS